LSMRTRNRGNRFAIFIQVAIFHHQPVIIVDGVHDTPVRVFIDGLAVPFIMPVIDSSQYFIFLSIYITRSVHFPVGIMLGRFQRAILIIVLPQSGFLARLVLAFQVF